MILKKPLTFKEQIQRLKDHNLVIEDVDLALKFLSKVNYYRFTGYLLSFRKSPQDSNLSESVSFFKICQIYKFDEKLRNFLRGFIELVEVYHKTQISYHFSLSRCIEPPHDQHYREENYFAKKGFNEIMDSFRKQKKYYTDSPIIKHHSKVYKNKLPIWVIVEFLSFSNTSKLYNSMLRCDKLAIAKAVNSGPSLLSNNLHCMSILRNKCAHAARLYNVTFSLPAKFPRSFLKRNSNLKNNTYLHI